MPGALKTGLPCPSCSSSDAFCIYENNDYCFSCHTSFNNKTNKGFMPKKPTFSGKLPDNVSDEFSKEAIGWLGAYGIKASYALECGLPYYKGRNAIIIPFISDKRLVGYQIRYIASNSRVKSHNIGSLRPYYITPHKEKSIVIVEDMRSGLKVSKTYNTLSLLGTHLKPCDRNYILENYDTIYLWLDGDDAGMNAANKLYDQFRLAGNPKIIYTKYDPKTYTEKEIRDLIDKA